MNPVTPTLAQYDEETWPDMRGMWAQTTNGHLVIIERIYTTEYGTTAHIIQPSHKTGQTANYAPAKNLTPRHDIPRAWNPDGTPPDGEWEYGEVNFGEILTDGLYEKTDLRGHVRRFTTDWEETTL